MVNNVNFRSGLRPVKPDIGHHLYRHCATCTCQADAKLAMATSDAGTQVDFELAPSPLVKTTRPENADKRTGQFNGDNRSQSVGIGNMLRHRAEGPAVKEGGLSFDGRVSKWIDSEDSIYSDGMGEWSQEEEDVAEDHEHTVVIPGNDADVYENEGQERCSLADVTLYEDIDKLMIASPHKWQRTKAANCKDVVRQDLLAFDAESPPPLPPRMNPAARSKRNGQSDQGTLQEQQYVSCGTNNTDGSFVRGQGEGKSHKDLSKYFGWTEKQEAGLMTKSSNSGLYVAKRSFADSNKTKKRSIVREHLGRFRKSSLDDASSPVTLLSASERSSENFRLPRSPLVANSNLLLSASETNLSLEKIAGRRRKLEHFFGAPLVELQQPRHSSSFSDNINGSPIPSSSSALSSIDNRSNDYKERSSSFSSTVSSETTTSNLSASSVRSSASLNIMPTSKTSRFEGCSSPLFRPKRASLLIANSVSNALLKRKKAGSRTQSTSRLLVSPSASLIRKNQAEARNARKRASLCQEVQTFVRQGWPVIPFPAFNFEDDIYDRRHNRAKKIPDEHHHEEDHHHHRQGELLSSHSSVPGICGVTQVEQNAAINPQQESGDGFYMAMSPRWYDLQFKATDKTKNPHFVIRQSSNSLNLFKNSGEANYVHLSK